MVELIIIFFLNLNGGEVKPPVPFKQEYVIEMHGDRRIDYYYWMRDRDSQKILSHLEAENRYTHQFMKDYKKIQKSVYKELKRMIKEDDETAKVKYGEYLYFRRYFKGKDYPVYYRQNIKTSKIEELVDVNRIAKGKDFCHLTSLKVSPDGKKIAFAVDYVGRRFYTIYFKDLLSGKILDDIKISSVTSNFVWGLDSNTVYYTKQDTQTLRWYEVYSFDLKNKQSSLIYRENDPVYSVYLTKSLSEKFVFINIDSTLTTEVRYIDLSDPGRWLKVFREREKGVEYSVEDGGDCFFIRHNYGAKNFMISTVSKDLDTSDIANWKDFIPYRKDVFIEDFDVFEKFVTVFERKDALVKLRIISRNSNRDIYVKFKDEVYVVNPGENMEYSSDFYRYEYESPVNPPSVYDYDIINESSVLVKQKEYPSYNPSLYHTERIWVISRDGVRIPVTILFKKDGKHDKLYIYGYGSYGYSIDPVFNFSIFPLLERGFVYAIAHVRGGSELGREWYENGRLLNKKNTFYDFIDVTRYLVDKGYGKNGVVAEGGSAGGLLVGAVANEASELYRVIIAEVPFVDCLTTMLDESIPLTTSEYDEWGDPRIKEYYDYIKSYSPYDNVDKRYYPNMLVTAGYHDSQVQYWEPAKWVAKLRENNLSDSVILLKVDMSAGHSGKTARYKVLEDIAFNYAFVMKIFGIK